LRGSSNFGAETGGAGSPAGISRRAKMVPVLPEHVLICCFGKTGFVPGTRSRSGEGTGGLVSEPVQPCVLEISDGGFGLPVCSPGHSDV
jgi:hypothetical protein